MSGSAFDKASSEGYSFVRVADVVREGASGRAPGVDHESGARASWWASKELKKSLNLILQDLKVQVPFSTISK